MAASVTVEEFRAFVKSRTNDLQRVALPCGHVVLWPTSRKRRRVCFACTAQLPKRLHRTPRVLRVAS